MRNALPIAALLMVFCGLPSDAHAQSLTFDIKDGRVTIEAQGVSVWEILQRWSAAGGVTFVDADQIPRTPVTLSLTREPEINALEILLRGVSGYIVARREPSDTAPSSSIDRVLIVANSVAPRVATPVAPQERRAGIAFVQQGPPAADDDDDVPSFPPRADVELGNVGNAGSVPAARPIGVSTGRPGMISSQGPGVSSAPAQSAPAPSLGPVLDMVDDFGNRVIGPTRVPPPPSASEGSSPPPPVSSGAPGSTRPGTITPVQQPQ